jgi:hypothetical protein
VVIPDAYTGSALAPLYRVVDGVRDWMNVSFEYKNRFQRFV